MDNNISASQVPIPIELNVNTDYEKLKVDVFLKTCQSPPDYQGILRLLEDEIKKIRSAADQRLVNLENISRRFAS